jgi:hypothetical protein
VRYPASWTTEQAEQAGVWYRYFLGPPTGPERKPAVSVTMLAGPLQGSVDEYAQSYLAGNTVNSSADEARGPARGKSYGFRSADGQRRYSLLLLQEDGRVYGLYAQGESDSFDKYASVLAEMAQSLTLERPASYPEYRNDKFAFSLRVPPSWERTQSFSGAGTYLVQFKSPPLAADRNRQTVHASLTATVEPIGEDGGVDTYYDQTRRKLGDAFQVVTHNRWKDGWVDVMRTETPIASSRVKRFYRGADKRGYSLTFESREDVFPRGQQWYDAIAMTLKTGAEVSR